MHDIDRTQMEFVPELESFEFSSGAEVFGEQEIMELATELLEVTNEQELDHFLGDLISKAGKAVGTFVSSPTGQALGGLLKGAAKKLLPMAGQAVGGYFGGAGGAKIGGQLASAAGDVFGLEAEGGDRELEAATNLVKLAGEAVKNVANGPQGANPRAAARAAMTEAAKIHAPSLLGAVNAGIAAANAAAANVAATGSAGSMGRALSGRWLRRGSKIVLYGV
jgi:hypothetical protein